MKKLFTLFALVAVLALAAPGFAMDMEKDSDKATDHSTMDHGSMEHGDMQKGETFVHAAMVDGMHAEFQVMSLASMNMTDPDGKTHHVMLSVMKGDKKLETLAGKVKLIAPSGKEQVATLTDYGSVFAANFTIDEPGKWGVICLFKAEGGKHTVKFWYPHHDM